MSVETENRCCGRNRNRQEYKRTRKLIYLTYLSLEIQEMHDVGRVLVGKVYIREMHEERKGNERKRLGGPKRKAAKG